MKTIHENVLKAVFHGACGKVTGSCLYFDYEGIQFLVDCGMIQGEAYEDILNAAKFPFRPSEISFVILTHAHLDHCGLIPRLIKEGFHGPVYATAATAEISKNILFDSAKLQKMKAQEEAKKIENSASNSKQISDEDSLKKKGKNYKQQQANLKVLYTHDDCRKIKWEIIDKVKCFKWGKPIPIANDLWMTPFRQSHVLGSMSVLLGWKAYVDGVPTAKSIHISGDVGNNRDDYAPQSLLRSRHEPYRSAEYVVCESTYGGRIHPVDLFSNRIEKLRAHLDDLKVNTLLIPVFAFHRMQEVLFDLFTILRYSRLNGNRSVKVLAHSPLGSRISKVYQQHLLSDLNTGNKPKWLNQETIDLFADNDNRHGLTGSLEMFKELLDKPQLVGNHLFLSDPRQLEENPSEHDIFVVLATAGMCEDGPINNYLFDYYDNPNAAILLTGYQSPSTRGFQLQALAENLENPDRPVPKCIEFKTEQKDGPISKIVSTADIKAKICRLQGYSGHADTESLVQYVLPTKTDHPKNSMSPKKTVFLIHGGIEERHKLKKAIQDRAAEDFGPQSQEPLEINVELPTKSSSWFDFNIGSWV